LIPLLIELSKVNDVRDAIPKFIKNNIVDFPLAFRVCNALQGVSQTPLKHDNTLSYS